MSLLRLQHRQAGGAILGILLTLLPAFGYGSPFAGAGILIRPSFSTLNRK